jgi:excisionase family DNA binding protein
MEISVAEAAQWLGVSDRRVQALAQDGRLPARLVSGAWLIDASDLGRPQARSRPMSPRVAAGLLRMLSEPGLNAASLGLAPSEVSRLRSRLRALLADRDPASLLASWLAREPRAMRLVVNPRDLPGIAADSRLVLSGISDPRSGLAIIDEVEGHICAADLEDFSWEHMLGPEGRANVRLHVSPGPLSSPVPLGRLLGDLAAHAGPRESDAVHRLLHAAAERGDLSLG